MPQRYECQKCGHMGFFLELAYWTDRTYRCPKCFCSVKLERDCKSPYVKITKVQRNANIIAIVMDGFYIAGVQSHCLQLAGAFRELGFQIMIIAIEAGGAWYKRFLELADYVYVPSTKLPICWNEIEQAFGESITSRIDICSCHLIIPIQWGIKEIPPQINIFAHLHSEPSEHEIVPPLFFEQLSTRVKRVFFPTLQTLNAYKAFSKDDVSTWNILHNGFSDQLQLPHKNSGRLKDDLFRIAIVSRVDCDKFSFSLLENTLKTMINKNILFEIIIAGNGDGMSTLRNIVEHLPIERSIKLVGFMDDPAPLYLWADLIFLPSKRESMPYVMLESLRFQVPIVLPLLGIAIDTALKPGVFAFDPNDENDAVNKIILAKRYLDDKNNEELMLAEHKCHAETWIEEVKLAYALY